MTALDDRPVFRFAPSPNGHLHLGHAFSALLNHDLAAEVGGRLLLRIEDIDTVRCTPQLERDMLEDLTWLGVDWEQPVRRQSDHFDDYQAALQDLVDAGVAYPSALSRGDVKRIVEVEEAQGVEWPRDPDGAPLFPGRAYEDRAEDTDMLAWRLDVAVAKAHLGVETVTWTEEGAGPDGETGQLVLDPAVWGDFVLARRDTPTSYHLSVVIDDALQGVTHVVRGRDLFHATAVHILLQMLFGAPHPIYVHHDLILEPGSTRKLSKSRNDTSLRAMRAGGALPNDIRRMVGL